MNNDMLPVGTTINIKPENVKWDSGDLISRSELKKALCKYARFDERIYLNEFIKEIDNAPTVERPKGKKIKKEAYGLVYPRWVYCSECNSEVGQQDNFCWNCGADLRGEE